MSVHQQQVADTQVATVQPAQLAQFVTVVDPQVGVTEQTGAMQPAQVGTALHAQVPSTHSGAHSAIIQPPHVVSVQPIQGHVSVHPQDAGLEQQYGEHSYTETRKVSSVVVESTVIGEVPQQDRVRYVEVPTIEEQVRYVQKKEVREIEKRIPKYEYEWIERVVERPVVVEKKRELQVPQYVDKIIEKKVKQVCDRPVEVRKEVRVPKVVTVEKVVEIPGEVIEVPKPYTVEVPVEIPHPVDKKVAVIVSQTVKPVIVEGSESMVVDVFDYEPEVIPVDVHIAKPVASALKFVGQTDAKHRVVNVTAAQYNAILRQLNSHMDEKIKSQLPYVSENNAIPFASDVQFIVAPENVWHGETAKTHQRIEQRQRGAEEGTSYVEYVESHPVIGEQKRKSRACCDTSKPKESPEPVVAAVHDVTQSHHSARSIPRSQQPSYRSGERTVSATQPHTVQTHTTRTSTHEQPAKDGSSSASYSTSSTTVVTQQRRGTDSLVSFGPAQAQQTKARACC